MFAESVKVNSLPLSTFPSVGRAGLTSILPFAGWVTVILYFTAGAGFASFSIIAETAVSFSIFTFCVMVLLKAAEYAVPPIVSVLTF